MSGDNSSMPASTIIPVLAYPDVAAAVEWLCRCFGFEERLRIGDHRAQLEFGTGAIVVVGASANAAAPAGHSIMVRVAHVDAHYRHVVTHGARVLGPPTDFPYGERQYCVEDLAGRVWTFSETIADIDPASWGGVLRTPR
jgi:uncharacterized glyoxalase superfamily protein PhnB